MNDRLKPWLQTLDLHPKDIPAAITLLTRLPIAADHAHAGARGARAAWAYPLVGAGLGAMAGIIGLLLNGFGVSGGIAAAAALACLILCSGGLHEDGLSDCADGFGGGNTAERSLEIMKDSRIGAFGAAAMILILLARWSGYEHVLGANWLGAIIAVGAISRLPMVWVMYALPLARNKGLAASVGQVTSTTAFVATGIALLFGLLCVGASAIPMIAIVGVTCLPLALLAQRRISGYTGDVLGGCQQLAEVAALAFLTTIL